MLRSNAMQRAVGRAFDRTYDRLERGAIAAARRNNAMLLYVPDVPGAALQFALGAYAIAPAGSPVGRLLDMQYGAPKLGPELLPETKFVDNYTFNFPLAGKASVSVGSTLSGPGTNVNFATNSVRFNNQIVPVVSSGAIELLQLLNQPIVAGSQTLSVKGFAQALGSYSGTVTFASAPEPATWGLMILGFGAVGYSLRRRRALTLVPAKA